MLRIATHQIYQQATKSIGQRQVELAKVQQQLATGNRIQSHADDPVGSSRLLGLNDELGRYEQYQRNIDVANSRLGIEDTALDGAGELLQQARELTIQAKTDTLSSNERQHIAKQVRQLHAQMLNVASTHDGNGEYLFSGFKSTTPPFVKNSANPNQIDYQGDLGQRQLKAGPHLNIAVGDSGQQVFQTDPNDANTSVFATLDKLAATLETSPASLHDDLGAAMSALDKGIENFSAIRTTVGVRMKALEEQEYANSDFSLHLQQTISEVGGLDYAEAATRLSQEALGLQVAQQSFMKIQSLSLFNYIS
jgi:flagellar hook-associated protein 3 FlgL